MKTNIKILTCLILSTFLLSSCSKKLTPFTDRLHNEFGWTEDDLKQIQFYLSEDIVLRRNIGVEESRISDGKIKVIDGREVEEIIFDKGTPGVMLFSPKTNRIAISFEEGPDRYLIFGPSSKVRGRYVLLAKDWNRRVGKVSYDGKIYTTRAESALATLLVDLDAKRKSKYNSTVVSGRKVD